MTHKYTKPIRKKLRELAGLAVVHYSCIPCALHLRQTLQSLNSYDILLTTYRGVVKIRKVIGKNTNWQPPPGTHGCTAFIITKAGSEFAQ